MSQFFKKSCVIGIHRETTAEYSFGRRATSQEGVAILSFEFEALFTVSCHYPGMKYTPIVERSTACMLQGSSSGKYGIRMLQHSLRSAFSFLRNTVINSTDSVIRQPRFVDLERVVIETGTSGTNDPPSIHHQSKQEWIWKRNNNHRHNHGIVAFCTLLHVLRIRAVARRDTS
jgi:hypothetical protein